MTLRCDDGKVLVVTCSDPRCEHVDGAFAIREAGGALFLACQRKVLSEQMKMSADEADRIADTLFRASLITLKEAAIRLGTPIVRVEVRIHSHCAAAAKLGLTHVEQQEAATEMALVAQKVFVGVEVVVVHDDHCTRGIDREVRQVPLSVAA